MTGQVVQAGGKWCPMCQGWAVQRCTDWNHAPSWYVPHVQPKQRSVVGTTLIVLFTIFVIAPALVGMILMVLIQLGAAVGG